MSKIGGIRLLRAGVCQKGISPTPHSHYCTIGTDGRSPTYKEDRPTANAPRNPATMGKSKEAPFRGARPNAAATVRAPPPKIYV